MEDDNTKDDEMQPSTSKKESQRDNSVDDIYVDSPDDDMANSDITIQSSGTYSVISKLDMAGTGPNLPKMPNTKTDKQSHQRRKREKTKRITGRIGKKKRNFPKRQAMRKALRRKPKTKDEKKERDLSMSTIFTRLSSSSQTPGCEYCGHRCCRRRFEYDLRRYYQHYENKRRKRNDNRYRKSNKKYNSLKITALWLNQIFRYYYVSHKMYKYSEGNQTGSCSKMFSPLFITTNSSPTDAPIPPIILHSEISPEMIQGALRMLTMWKQDVPTSAILDYLIRNYPVNNDKEILVDELVDKLRIAAILGIVCRTSEDTWSLTHEFQKRRVSRNHVTIFWKMYSDTLKPVSGKQDQQKPPGENKETATRARILTIYDEEIL